MLKNSDIHLVCIKLCVFNCPSLPVTIYTNSIMGTYRKHLDFIRKEGELLVVEVILEIDVNWSQCL